MIVTKMVSLEYPVYNFSTAVTEIRHATLLEKRQVFFITVKLTC